MVEVNIFIGKLVIFIRVEIVKEYIIEIFIVIKVDGLVVGKGVIVVIIIEMVYNVIDRIFEGEFDKKN